MEKLKKFDGFLNEYWTSHAPGSVIVPGEWYKDGVNSRNYKPNNTTMPHVVDPILEDSEFEKFLDSMRTDEELLGKIKGSSDPLEILDLIKKDFISKRAK